MSSIAGARTLFLAVGALLVLGLLRAAVVPAPTREIALDEPNPLLERTTLLFANLTLALVVVVQAARNVRQRRHPFQVAPSTPAVGCGRCGRRVRLTTAHRPAGYRCPRCGHAGVAP